VRSDWKDIGRFNNPGRGFTLIELLVVVGVIAVVESLLLPVVRNARELSAGLVCASNLRQVGMVEARVSSCATQIALNNLLLSDEMKNAMISGRMIPGPRSSAPMAWALPSYNGMPE
jgi:prepilin-type N-terminal cleavage/methylation domain-containing protein